MITRRHAGAAGLLLFLALFAQEHDAGGRGKHHAHPQGHLAAIGSLDGGDILGGRTGTGRPGRLGDGQRADNGLDVVVCGHVGTSGVLDDDLAAGEGAVLFGEGSSGVSSR